MNIGILTYYSVCNFGANLQAFSTYSYLIKHGHNPIFINWMPEDLEKYYALKTPQDQIKIHETFIAQYLTETMICRTDEDIVNVIENNNIDAVLIGSDAVFQHRSFLSRIFFTKKGLKYINPLSDQIFPNPFWGSFYSQLHRKIPIIYFSVSAQNTDYFLFSGADKRKMRKVLANASYISVRDSWTQKMISVIFKNKIKPDITPDPVFAFNHNVDIGVIINNIREKFELPEKYILLTLPKRKNMPDEQWLVNFVNKAKENGYACVSLPLPQGTVGFNSINSIPLPLSPLEWYALIKNASGYVGINMHPIIVCLHNSVPFFSFDNYGIKHFKFFNNKNGSKINHILQEAGLLSNRLSVFGRKRNIVSEEYVLNMILRFNKEKCAEFSRQQHNKYIEMMNKIENIISQ